MQITPEFVKQLVQRNESQVLDFKRDQYKLKKDTNGKKATNEEKSELLKDILAFANAFNDWILFGAIWFSSFATDSALFGSLRST